MFGELEVLAGWFSLAAHFPLAAGWVTIKGDSVLRAILDFDDYDEVFTPGAPMENGRFFFGRDQELSDLERAIKRRGHHPIVIGNRGVGKTSLVRQAFTNQGVKSVFVTCNSRISFDEFARNTLEEIGLDISSVEVRDSAVRSFEGKGAPFGVGARATRASKTDTTRKPLWANEIDPWTFYRLLRKHPEKIVIILDEYDVVGSRKNREFHGATAELIKTLADNSLDCDSRLVVVGVSHSAQALLGRHESIERSAREIYLRPLRREDVADFLSQAEQSLGFEFLPQVKRSIIMNSGGYPYFVHLVGLECLDAMTRRAGEGRLVEMVDYENAMRRSVQRAFRSELRKYREAMLKLGEGEMALVRMLARISIDRGVTRAELRNRLKKNGVNPGEFNDMLLRLQQERHLVYISRNKDEVRFADPLMAPFLRLAIFPKRESLDRDQLELFG
ncbi:MAG: ATP-binding protein [Acidobacteriota bacterium]|nr:ATP-binding protein [Acidobacteriota bacterium]